MWYNCRSVRASLVALAALIAVCATSPCAAVERTSVTVLHTNDIHAHLSPRRDGVEPTGGLARIATLVNRIRRAERYVVLLDAGDVVFGTPFHSFYGGRAEIECLNALGYDAVVVGNHELDNGPSALLEFQNGAQFDFLSANLIWRRSGERLVKPYILLEAEDVRVAVLGLSHPGISAIVRPSAVTAVAATNPITVARELVPVLRREADAVIVLSHLGLESDKSLARQVPGIDLIVGGHSHTLLKNPIVVKRRGKQAGQTYIVQAGEEGRYLGRADLFFEDRELVAIEAEVMPVASVIPEDPRLERTVRKFWDSMEEAVTEVVAYAAGPFEDSREMRYRETALGNLIADIVKDAVGADFAVQNAGGIRGGFGPGPVTVWDVYTALPFDNRVVKLELTGYQVEGLVDDIARRTGRSSFCQVSGITFSISDGKASDVRVAGLPLQLKAKYTVGVVDYLAEGGAGFEVLARARTLSSTRLYQRDLAVLYMKRLKTLHPRIEGRIRTDE